MSEDRRVCPEISTTLDDERDAYAAAMDATDLGFDHEEAEPPDRRLNVLDFLVRHRGTGRASVRGARRAP